MSRLVAGLIYRDGDAYAAYQVHWTLGQVALHGATFYVILGYWGEGTLAADRYAVALGYQSDPGSTGFMVVDAGETAIASHPLVGRALGRKEVIGSPLAQEVFDIIDFIWLRDERISEILGSAPTPSHRSS